MPSSTKTKSKTKKDSNQGKLFQNSGVIYHIPDESESFPETERFILSLLAERHEFISSSCSPEEWATQYLSLDQIEMALGKSKIPEKNRTPGNVDLAIRHILDLDGESKNRLGYLYPILYVENDKIKARIVVLSPQVDSITEVAPLRQTCFEASIPVIEKILSGELALPAIYNERKDPEKLLIQDLHDDQTPVYFPAALSFEERIKMFIQTYFYPYTSVSVLDFIEDFIIFATPKNRMIELASNYHLLKGDYKIDCRGDLLGIPEIYVHFQANIKILHQLLLTHIFENVKLLELEDQIAQIDDYKISFSGLFNQYPDREIDRLNNISQIIQKIPSGIGLPENVEKLLTSMRIGCGYLYAIYSSLSILHEEAIESLLNEQLDKFVNRISIGSRDKKILQIVRIPKAPEVEAILDKELSKQLEVMISNYIHNNFGYYDETVDGNKVYFVVDPKFFSGVLLNHANLSKTGETGLKQYKLAQRIEYILKDGILRHILDSGYTAKELNQIKSGLKAIADEVKQKKILEDKLSKFNPRAAIFGGIISFLILFSIFRNFKSDMFTLISLPISLGLSFYFGKLFRLKKREEIGDEIVKKPIKKQPVQQIVAPPKEESLFELVEPIIFPNSYKSITERIYTSKKIKKFINENYKALNIKAGKFLKDKDQEKGKLILENSVNEECFTVIVPKNLIPKNQPSQYIFNKKDIENSKTKTAILSYFTKVSQLVDPPDVTFNKYYKHIIEQISQT